MSEPIPHRRRWRNVCLGLVLVIVVGSIVWIFRPLTGTERALIGTWHAPWGEITFEASRRYRIVEAPSPPAFVSHGSWSARVNRLSIRPDLGMPLRWNTLLVQVRALLSLSDRTGTGTVTFANPNRLQVLPDDSNSRPETWVRVREPTPEPPPARPAE